MNALKIAAMMMGGGAGAPVYATFNPSDKSTNATLSDADLTVGSSSAWQSVRATVGKSTGKWYYEFTVTGLYAMLGLMDDTSAMPDWYFASVPNSGAIYPNSGAYWAAGDFYVFGAAPGSPNSGDVYGIAFDAAAKKAWFRKNGAWAYGDPVAGTDPAMTWLAATVFPAVSPYATVFVHANFGQSAFAHAVPSGFNAGVYT